MGFSIQDVMRLVAEQDVRFIRLQFTDILGIVKNVAIPASQLERAFNNEVMFDGSSIEGFTRVEESDMNLRPDPTTFALLPWRPRESAVARLICDVYNPDGSPFAGDPRHVLRRALDEAAAMGFSVQIGAECEFFLFHRSPEGKPLPVTHDKAGYFDLEPVDLGEDARRDIVITLAEMGLQVEASHHEVAPGQHEIDLGPCDALAAADQLVTLKFVTRTIAARHNLHATFMPKPLFGVNGSGMHVHIALFREGRNAFYDPQREHQLSETALRFLAGLLYHARAFTAITNPLVNSYKRLVPGYEAPVYVSWSVQNRSTLVRVPAARGEHTRLELRSPDPACNAYLALAVLIRAGLDGIRRRLEPPPAVNRNIYTLNQAERAALGIKRLPRSLDEALEAMENDPLMKEALGEHVYSHFLAAKRIEWDIYSSQVSNWELDQYLGVF
ncbi:MAG: glutamine synthetase [Limnochordales bacterium]|nr:glutamine synthetase [Limnochordales bacterium]